MSVPLQRDVLAYCRVSTDIQAETGVSIQSQKERIEGWVSYKRYNLKKYYVDDGISAGTMNRPELMRMLKDCREGDIIITADLSRLSRSMEDAITIIKLINKHGGELVCLSPDIDFSTPQGKLLMHMLFAISEFERSQIKERVKATMKTVSTSGKLRSKAPFGWKFVGKDQEMVHCDEQQVVIERIIKDFESGMTFTTIAHALNCEGLNEVLQANKRERKEGQLFLPQTIKRILRDNERIPANGHRVIAERYMASRVNDK